MLTEKEYKDDLHQEGFKTIEVLTDPPGKNHGEHTHEAMIAYVILEGELTLVEKGTMHILRPGERFDVPRGAAHSTRVGMAGCRYLRASF